jgi:hypothetical protein
MPDFRFVVSSFCYETGCVGVAATPDGGVAVTNTSVDGAPVVTFTESEWAVFLRGAAQGEFEPTRLHGVSE